MVYLIYYLTINLHVLKVKIPYFEVSIFIIRIVLAWFRVYFCFLTLFCDLVWADQSHVSCWKHLPYQNRQLLNNRNYHFSLFNFINFYYFFNFILEPNFIKFSVFCYVYKPITSYSLEPTIFCYISNPIYFIIIRAKG